MLQKEKLVLDEQDEIVSGSIIGLARENNFLNKEQIPQLIEIEEYQGLFIIPGRPLMCVSCLQYGHKAAFCSKVFCKNCKKKLDKKHKCDFFKGFDTKLMFKENNINISSHFNEPVEAAREKHNTLLSWNGDIMVQSEQSSCIQWNTESPNVYKKQNLGEPSEINNQGAVAASILTSSVKDNFDKEEDRLLQLFSEDSAKETTYNLRRKKKQEEVFLKTNFKSKQPILFSQSKERELIEMEINKTLSQIEKIECEEIEFSGKMEKQANISASDGKIKVKIKKNKRKGLSKHSY